MPIIQPIQASDRANQRELIEQHWGASVVIAHGQMYMPHNLPGWIAIEGAEWLGMVTINIEESSCEIVTLDSFRENQGIGTALIATVLDHARRQHCSRVWLVTTNDNMHALRFYQKRGFELVAIHRGAIHTARILKPSIPLIGQGGIPIRDEIELEIRLHLVGAA
jgi:GNAT superfamily N-acetyltransferase